MNSWDSTDDGSKASTLQGLEYSVGLIFATFILAVIAVYLYMRWTITLASTDGPSGPDSVIVIVHQGNASDGNAPSSSSSYPQFIYSEIGAHKINESHATACSICLVDYEETDLIRLLPICGHIFHLKCIDPWLVLHPTCPVCRSSPTISTPLAQNMNSTNSYSTDDGSKPGRHIEGVVYDISLTLAIFVMFAIVFYMYMRLMFQTVPNGSINGPAGQDSVIVAVHESNGLDDTTSPSLSSYPQFAYSEIGAHKINESYASACSICLADYEETDLIRLLPSCGHLFHLKCIDPWLILHPTCPVCRSSPLPGSTPPPTT